MRILIVDDHVLFREGLISMLGSQPGMEIVGQAGSVSEAINKASELKPDLVLMDILLPDGSGLDAVKAILSRTPDTQIVVLTIYESDELLISAIRCGARGYLLKNTPIAKLVASLRALERGEAALSRTMTARLLEGFTRIGNHKQDEYSELTELTPREVEVLVQLASDSSNRQIAERLFIAENTVKIHVHNILKKLDLRSRHEAARLSRRLGLANNNHHHHPT